ncbi:S13A5-like protein, partial [Mya arenaria]
MFENIESHTVFKDKTAEKEYKALAKALCFCVAYGAFCGGMATITGTPPNLVLKDVVDKYESLELLQYFTTFDFNFCFKKMDPDTKAAINAAIKKRAKSLGSPSYTPILKWQMVTKRLPWGVLILVGGGFAMARASQLSGLSVWIGNLFRDFARQDPTVMMFVILIVVGFTTEVMSNPATAQLYLPILRDMSVSIGINPLYLMIAATTACSFSFMLPTAAPPTAIVFATGYISIPDMAMAGFPMKLIGIAMSMLAVNTWGTWIFELDKLQDFLKTDNNTAFANSTFNTLFQDSECA